MIAVAFKHVRPGVVRVRNGLGYSLGECIG